MENVAGMTHQELIDGAKGRWGLGKVAVCEAELLCRLGAAVSASPQPRCPQCGTVKTIWIHIRESESFPILVGCTACESEWIIKSFSDFAQFFAAAPAQEPRQVRNLDEIDESHIAAQEQPVENSPILQWLNDRVHDERGAIEFGMTEDGNLGLFRSGEETPWALGDDVEEVLYRAAKKYPSGKDYEPSPEKGKP